MADLRKHSSISNVVRVGLKHATTGAPLTGLTNASAGLIIGTVADNEATTTRYRADSSEIEGITTLGTFAAPSASKCRFKEVDATNHPGIYEFQFADARFAVASAKRLVISWSGATNLLAGDYEIQLTLLDPYDAVRAGLTALPNANAEASGGLPTLSAAQASNGTIQANVHRWLTGTPNALQAGRVDSYLGAAAAGVIAAATFAANALDAVWSTSARTLTSIADLASEIRAAVGLASANLDTQLGAIDAKTTNLPSDPADQSLIIAATNAIMSAIGDVPTVAEFEARTLAAAAIAKLSAHLDGVLTFETDAGGTTTAVKLLTVNGGAPSSEDDFYNGAVIVFTSGALAGQRTDISAYNGTTKVATVTALTGAPVSGVVGVIV